MTFAHAEMSIVRQYYDRHSSAWTGRRRLLRDAGARQMAGQRAHLAKVAIVNKGLSQRQAIVFERSRVERGEVEAVRNVRACLCQLITIFRARHVDG